MPSPQPQNRRAPETLTAIHAQTLVDITEMSRRPGNVVVKTHNWVYR